MDDKRVDAENEPGFGMIPYWERADGPHYRLRDLDQYCRSRGVAPTDLPAAELEQFESSK